eukprot:Rhum_TRINITY_DN6140_c0_g1::Rhum_TRINITY_DN6140_c0_g1_i1::g.19247::m.19247
MGFLSTGLFDRSRVAPQPVYQAEAKDGVEADPVCSDSTHMIPTMQKTEYYAPTMTPEELLMFRERCMASCSEEFPAKDQTWARCATGCVDQVSEHSMARSQELSRSQTLMVKNKGLVH